MPRSPRKLQTIEFVHHLVVREGCICPMNYTDEIRSCFNANTYLFSLPVAKWIHNIRFRIQFVDTNTHRSQVVSPAPQGFPQNQLAQKLPAQKHFGFRWTTSSVTSNRSVWELPSRSFFANLLTENIVPGCPSSTQPLSERQCVETVDVGQFASPETTAADVVTWHGLKHLHYTKLPDVNDLSLKNAFEDRNGLVLPRWDPSSPRIPAMKHFWRC